MSLVQVQDLSLRYGSKVLFDQAAFAVGPHDRIGLVGANGTGKSSLLKILAGECRPDSGHVQVQRKIRVGYLPQDLYALPEGSIVDSVLRSVPGRDALETELEETQRALERSTEVAEQLELSEQLAELHVQVDQFEQRFGRHRAERILLGLGFQRGALADSTGTLSGGWRMRAALAGLLLQDPDLLLLDEPTNHLDLPTLAWFEQFLKSHRKAIVLISHDRSFLNRQIGRVLALEIEGLKSYTGNYEDYRRQREEELDQLVAQAEKQQARRAEMIAFIERFKAKASKARQAQSRMKMLEREEIITVQKERDTLDFAFPEAPRSGREVARFENVTKRYGNRDIYRGVSLSVDRGSRIAVVGRNGAGKTTLLKMLAGELVPDEGSVALGHQVVMGYYAQHHADTLNKHATILGEARALAPRMSESALRGVLGAFMFSGDDVDKKIGVLSGGERARVALARLLLQPSNLLVMDEPTNHLDLDSSEALIDALSSYTGTLIFVSHNRSFLNRCATTVWDVVDAKVVPYPGNLDDYLHHLEVVAKDDDVAPEAKAETPTKISDKDRRRLEAEERARRSSLEGPVKKEIARLEKLIEVLEKQKAEHEAALADPDLYNDFNRAKPLMDAHRLAEAELAGLYQKWEAQQQTLEGLTAAAAKG